MVLFFTFFFQSGLNDCVAAITQQLEAYGVRHIRGVRWGLRGFYSQSTDSIVLNAHSVKLIAESGGTVLGTTRGGADVAQIADGIQNSGYDMVFVGARGNAGSARALLFMGSKEILSCIFLFVRVFHVSRPLPVGGNGGNASVVAIDAELERRGVPCAVVGSASHTPHKSSSFVPSFTFSPPPLSPQCPSPSTTTCCSSMRASASPPRCRRRSAPSRARRSRRAPSATASASSSSWDEPAARCRWPPPSPAGRWTCASSQRYFLCFFFFFFLLHCVSRRFDARLICLFHPTQVPFDKAAVCDHILRLIADQGHAVVVVAEGAGQDIIRAEMLADGADIVRCAGGFLVL